MTRRQQQGGLARLYARKADTARIVQAAPASLDHVAIIECVPDSAIKASSLPVQLHSPKSAVDMWSEAGKL